MVKAASSVPAPQAAVGSGPVAGRADTLRGWATKSRRRFAEHWLKAWNSRDLEAVLSHFSDDVVFSSPMAAQLCEGCDGVVQGKAALRDYWAEGLRRVPELHFEIESLYVGVRTLVINYRNQAGGLLTEVLVFDRALVAEGHGTYLVGDAGEASGASSTPGSAARLRVIGISRDQAAARPRP